MASILQNLPSTGANPARSAGRNLAKAFDNSEKSQSFEQTLDRTARRSAEATESNRAKPAERPERVDRSAEPKEKTETVEESKKPEQVEDSAKPKLRAKTKKSEKGTDEPAEDSAGQATDASESQAKPATTEGDETATTELAQLFSDALPVQEKAVVTSDTQSTTPVATDLNLTSTIAIEEVAAAQVAVKASTETTAQSVDVDEQPDGATAAIDPLAQLSAKAKPVVNASGNAANQTAGDESEAAVPADVDLAGFEIDPKLADESLPQTTEFDTATAAKPEPALKPNQKNEEANPLAEDAAKAAVPATPAPVESTPAAHAQSTEHALEAIAPTAPQPAHSMKAETVQAPRSIEPAQKFIEDNHPQIVSGVRGQLLPNGGTMQIRLDPPELGALMVQVTMRDGLMDASFQTSNAEASQMLSHSLTQLKHSLETAGVNVDRITVAQAPRNESSNNSQNDRNNNQQQQGQGQMDWDRHSDQQRKEMLKRMWAKLGVGDPLDVVA